MKWFIGNTTKTGAKPMKWIFLGHLSEEEAFAYGKKNETLWIRKVENGVWEKAPKTQQDENNTWYVRENTESIYKLINGEYVLKEKTKSEEWGDLKNFFEGKEPVKASRSFEPKDYEEYLEKHIGNVQKAYAFMIDAGIVNEDEKTRTNIENHDQSKYSDEEFDPYGERFYGKYKDREEDDPEFKKAWLHHQHNNPHHWQHWCLLEDDNAGKVECLDMPEEYIVEMVCDWLSFSIENNDLSEIQKWYKEKKNKQKLSDKTRARVEDLLSQIDDKKSLWVNNPTAGLYGNTMKSVKPVWANGDMLEYYRDHPEELKKKKEENEMKEKEQIQAMATPEEKRRIIEQRLRGETQNRPNARDSEFDPGVYELLRQNPRLMGYIEPWMDTAQAVVIQDAIDAGVDVSKLQDPKYNFMQMQAILDYLKEGIDVTKYTKDGRNALIIRQIGEAIRQGMTESQIRQMLFMRNWKQMQQIRLGHKAGIDVSSYATKPGMDWTKMQEIRKRLMEEKRKTT